MGNFLRRSCAVHPDSGDGRRRRHMEEEPPQEEERRRSLRIKVRMRRDQLEELLYLARHNDQSDGNKGKIGYVILKECMEGRLPANVLLSGDDVRSQRCGSYVVSRRLDSITED